MGKITIEEIDEATAIQQLAREQALAQANFHAGYLQCLKEIKERLEEPKEVKSVELNKPIIVETPANGANNVRQIPNKITKPKTEQGQ